MQQSSRQPGGFTMLEVLIASSILSFAVLAVVQAVSVAQNQTYEALHNQRATSLIEAFLEEATSKPYLDPQGTTTTGPDSGENTRSAYDNIDDYHNFTLDGLKTTPDTLSDVAGNAYPASYQKFTLNITAVYTSVAITALNTTITGITVTVTATDAKARQWQISRFIPASS